MARVAWMDAEFWHERWREGRTGFHRPEVNPWLVAHLPRLALAAGARVLVPLCGKSLDLGWLADRGLRPVGVEISPLALEALFAARGVEAPERASAGALERWTGGGIEAFCGDFLALDAETLGPCDALWDRAALIALPAHLRPAYVRHCAALVRARATGLLVTMEYDAGAIEGPPFSVGGDEVEDLYGPWFEVDALVPAQPGEPSEHLRERGLTGMREAVWLLTRRDDHDDWGEAR